MDDVDALLARARELDLRGADEDAKAAYLGYLQHRPDDFGALIDLGNLAFRTGYRSAARTVYRRATQVDPGSPLARVNLGNALLDAGDLTGAQCEYQAALSIDSFYAPAHRGLSYVYARGGDEAASRVHRERGFRGDPLTRIPYRGTRQPIRVLVLISAAGGNFNTEWFLDPHRYEVTRLAAEYADSDAPLPEHDVLINAIGDADRCAEALHRAARLMTRTSASIVNDPAGVLKTGRIATAERLAVIPDLIVPKIASILRADLEHDGESVLRRHGFEFPVLLRVPGHHTGRYFMKVEGPSDLSRALAVLPGDELLAIAYVDVRDSQGFARKYRVMFVDGKLYPVHAAISRDWKVHYFTADMSASEAHRAEDARFIEDPASVLQPGALDALRTVARTLALDYAGVDFAFTRSGELIVFEANATMSVATPERDDRWAYRRPAIDRVFRAFDELLLGRMRNHQ